LAADSRRRRQLTHYDMEALKPEIALIASYDIVFARFSPLSLIFSSQIVFCH